MAKRSFYSRVSRRLRHIADADEVRGLGKQPAQSDAEAAPLLRYVQPLIALVGAAALVVLVVWAAMSLAG